MVSSTDGGLSKVLIWQADFGMDHNSALTVLQSNSLETLFPSVRAREPDESSRLDSRIK